MVRSREGCPASSRTLAYDSWLVYDAATARGASPRALSHPGPGTCRGPCRSAAPESLSRGDRRAVASPRPRSPAARPSARGQCVARSSREWSPPLEAPSWRKNRPKQEEECRTSCPEYTEGRWGYLSRGPDGSFPRPGTWARPRAIPCCPRACSSLCGARPMSPWSRHARTRSRSSAAGRALGRAASRSASRCRGSD